MAVLSVPPAGDAGRAHYPWTMAGEGKTGRPRTVQERQQAQREAKLAAIREQVESGSLVIRKMTKAEREQYPAQNRPAKRRGR